MLDSLITPYENAVQLLCTIPGVDRNSLNNPASVSMLSGLRKPQIRF